jgi:hypothetical protein
VKRWLSATAVFAIAAPLWAVAPAEAAAAYRYWQYWKVTPQSSSWSFAQVGPASRPAHGTVEGWRFGVSANSGNDTPRVSAGGLFDQICTPGQPPDGQKRVAVVIDYGLTADSPPGETPPKSTPISACVTTEIRATGLDVLGEVTTSIRTCSSGLIGGINGYPRTECGDVVVQPKPSSTPKPTAPTSPAPQSEAPVGPAAGAGSGTASGTSGPGTDPPGSGAAKPASSSTSESGSISAAPSASATDLGGSGQDATEQTGVEQLNAAATASNGPADNGSPVGLLVTVGLLAALLGGAAYARRRA